MSESSASASASPPDYSGVTPSSTSTADADRPYHSKRPHKKSRTGCKNCKARKVKCDEARPSCRYCRLRKTECVYPSPSDSKSTSLGSPVAAATKNGHLAPSKHNDFAYFPNSPAPSAGSSNSNGAGHPSMSSSMSLPPNAVNNPSPPFITPGAEQDLASIIVTEPLYRPTPAVDDFDMRLLWFYTTATCASFSVERGVERPMENIMRTKLVQHAFQVPFLMDSLFALSSLHLQYLKQEVDPNRTLMYRVRSFEGYRKAIEEANPITYPALMANSLILTALSSQNFRDPEAKDLYIIDWMVVWRGIGVLIDLMGKRRFAETGMLTLFYRPEIDFDLATAAIPNDLLYMVSSIPPSDPDFMEVESYYLTLKYLGSLYYNLRGGIDPILNLRIITWFTFLPRKFIELGREHRPRALVIIAYYAAFAKLTKEIWWLTGVGERTLRDLYAYLSPEWHSFMLVPISVTGMQDHLEISRTILEDSEWNATSLLASDSDALAQAMDNLNWVDNSGNHIDLSKGDVDDPITETPSYFYPPPVVL